jgi:hypothetical protein
VPARLVQQVIEEGPATDVENGLGDGAGQRLEAAAEAADQEDGLFDVHAAADVSVTDHRARHNSLSSSG